MSQGREYTVSFQNVSVAAAQDMLAVYAGANMAFEVVSFGVGPSNTTVENLLINVKRLPATVTTGSGGAAVTPAPDQDSDSSAQVTARRNDTTQATTSGTATYHYSSAVNEVNGIDYIFPTGLRPVAKPNEAIVFEVTTAPGAGRTMSGYMKVRELF